MDCEDEKEDPREQKRKRTGDTDDDEETIPLHKKRKHKIWTDRDDADEKKKRVGKAAATARNSVFLLPQTLKCEGCSQCKDGEKFFSSYVAHGSYVGYVGYPYSHFFEGGCPDDFLTKAKEFLSSRKIDFDESYQAPTARECGRLMAESVEQNVGQFVTRLLLGHKVKALETSLEQSRVERNRSVLPIVFETVPGPKEVIEIMCQYVGEETFPEVLAQILDPALKFQLKIVKTKAAKEFDDELFKLRAVDKALSQYAVENPIEMERRCKSRTIIHHVYDFQRIDFDRWSGLVTGCVSNPDTPRELVFGPSHAKKYQRGKKDDKPCYLVVDNSDIVPYILQTTMSLASRSPVLCLDVRVDPQIKKPTEIKSC